MNSTTLDNYAGLWVLEDTSSEKTYGNTLLTNGKVLTGNISLKIESVSSEYSVSTESSVSNGQTLITPKLTVSTAGWIDAGTYTGAAVAGSNDEASSISYTGVGNSCFTAYQTDASYKGRSGWATYLICNHGNGENYYHQMIAMPFWGVPCYQRLEGGTLKGWKEFVTDENFNTKMANYISSHTYNGTYE